MHTLQAADSTAAATAVVVAAAGNWTVQPLPSGHGPVLYDNSVTLYGFAQPEQACNMLPKTGLLLLALPAAGMQAMSDYVFEQCRQYLARML